MTLILAILLVVRFYMKTRFCELYRIVKYSNSTNRYTINCNIVHSDLSNDFCMHGDHIKVFLVCLGNVLNMEKKAKQKPHFMLSGFPQEQKKDLAKQIKHLGGKYTDTEVR